MHRRFDIFEIQGRDGPSGVFLRGGNSLLTIIILDLSNGWSWLGDGLDREMRYARGLLLILGRRRW
jgi:hypothetical protein